MTPIAKNYYNGVICRITMRNLIIIATSSKEIQETINFFQVLQNIGRYLGKEGDREVEAGVFMGRLKETEHICQLTNGRLRQECLLDG